MVGRERVAAVGVRPRVGLVTMLSTLLNLFVTPAIVLNSRRRAE